MSKNLCFQESGNLQRLLAVQPAGIFVAGVALEVRVELPEPTASAEAAPWAQKHPENVRKSLFFLLLTTFTGSVSFCPVTFVTPFVIAEPNFQLSLHGKALRSIEAARLTE
jgi:hypothetical protein